MLWFLIAHFLKILCIKPFRIKSVIASNRSVKPTNILLKKMQPYIRNTHKN